MQQGERIAVVGAGIVGLCTAYSLRQAGHAVTLFDPNPPGSQCSSGNAGALSSRSVVPLATPGIIKKAFSMLLDPTSPLHVPAYYWLQAAPWLARFVAASNPERVRAIAAALSGLLRGSVDAHARIAAEIGVPDLVRRAGQLHLYADEAAYAQDKSSWALKQEHGLRLEPVDRAAIEALEPAIGPGYRAGAFLPEGTVVLKTTIAGEHNLALAPIVIDEVRVIGSRCGPFPPAIAALESREIDVTPLIQAEYGLDEADEAFRVAGSRGARKVLLRM